jgi:hypothetical protein
MAFTITKEEVIKRRKNIFLGLLFSIGIAVLMGYMNGNDSTKYNDLLFGSIVFFLVFANIINAFRYVQWLKLITTHRIEIGENSLDFFKGEAESNLKADNMAKLCLKKKDDQLLYIIVELNIGNKIRLEGYNDMDGLLAALKNVGNADLFIYEK